MFQPMESLHGLTRATEDSCAMEVKISSLGKCGNMYDRQDTKKQRSSFFVSLRPRVFAVNPLAALFGAAEVQSAHRAKPVELVPPIPALISVYCVWMR
jgi:hypothetical protein